MLRHEYSYAALQTSPTFGYWLRRPRSYLGGFEEMAGLNPPKYLGHVEIVPVGHERWAKGEGIILTRGELRHRYR